MNQAAIDIMIAGHQQIIQGLALLRDDRTKAAIDPVANLDPKDPANKYDVGGLQKLTPRGVEVCYRLFDAGKSRYAVAQLMDISFGAATHRYEAWLKAGGIVRIPKPLA